MTGGIIDGKNYGNIMDGWSSMTEVIMVEIMDDQWLSFVGLSSPH